MSDFQIPIHEDQSLVFEKMKEAIKQQDGELNGDHEKGSFIIPIAIGKVEGEYVINHDSIAINVTKKPMIVSKNMIKEAIQKFMNDQ